MSRCPHTCSNSTDALAAEAGVEPLDGNAIAGDLFNLFGQEMTTVTGECGHCGAVGLIAELRVFVKAPGSVARCRRCGQVVLVVVGIRGETRIDLDQFKLEAPLLRPPTPA